MSPSLAALVGLGLAAGWGCQPVDTGHEGEVPEAAGSNFPATPPDGPLPEIGPAPEGYRPTAAGAPSTDIWLGRLARDGGELTLRDLVRATDREGYDNQPVFAPDGEDLYFVSAVDTLQTEIMRLPGTGAEPARLTRTPDASEFSPTPIPGQPAVSAIREIRGLQFLWRYGADGADLGAIFSTAEPVGYHAWADERTVAMFILGDPATLHIGDAVSGEVRLVAERPGRSIHRVPGSRDVSFVRKISDDEWWIERLDLSTLEAERLVRTLPGREDYAWTPQGEILMGDGATLHRWTAGSGWTELADLTGLGLSGITRLAVSPDGGRIAIVADRNQE